MESSWPTVMNAVDRCLRKGIVEFVVCGGARNALLLEAIARLEESGLVRVWRHFEERSAGFFALGRSMETGRPCAVVTTSGTAAAELLPAAIEAAYQARPLVLLTADRPAPFRNSGAPQTIDQTNLFGPYASRQEIEDWDGLGPIHWNVELGEDFHPAPLFSADLRPGSFDARHPRPAVAALARWLRTDAYRGFVVLIGGLEPEEREEVFHFCRDFKAPVVADATSGLREILAKQTLQDADRILRSHPPGKILRIGEIPVGRFWRDLEENNTIDVWSICRNGMPGLARPSQVTRGQVDRILRALGEIEPVDDALDLLVGSPAHAAAVEECLEAYPDSEPGLIRSLSHYASVASGVYLGNSLPIREWNLYAQWSQPVPNVRANRGANGIDGQISTWLGNSADQPHAWAILGDLTTLYDLSALALLNQVQSHGRVLAVIHNSGGRIFDNLPRLAGIHSSANKALIQSHSANFSGLATLWGIRHVSIRTSDDLDQIDMDASTTLLEVIPDPDQTCQLHRALGRI